MVDDPAFAGVEQNFPGHFNHAQAEFLEHLGLALILGAAMIGLGAPGGDRGGVAPHRDRDEFARLTHAFEPLDAEKPIHRLDLGAQRPRETEIGLHLALADLELENHHHHRFGPFPPRRNRPRDASRFTIQEIAPIVAAMAILKIARMGHPVLKRREPVADPGAAEIARLIADMAETLDDAGGIGMAAPQVHVPLRLVIIEVPAARLDADETDDRVLSRQVLINPVITPLSDAVAIGWEGCLSVPDLRGAVPRHKHIRYTALSPAGDEIAIEAEGFHARVVQHECDHLDGVLYPMRMTDLSTLHYLSEMKHQGDVLEIDDEDDRQGDAAEPDAETDAA